MRQSNNSSKKPKLKVTGTSNYVYIVTSLFFLTSLIIFFHSISSPASIEKSVDENVIVQETTFDYAAKVQPSTLYRGGIISPGDKPIFTKITDELLVTINSTINTIEPVVISGTSQVDLVIEAEGMWTHIIPLSENKTFQVEGTNNSLLEKTHTIKLQDVFATIENIEEEVGFRASRINFMIAPHFDGEISFKDKKIPIDLNQNLIFESSGLQLTLLSETEFSQTLPIVSKQTISQNYRLFGLELPLSLVRIVSLLVSISLLAFLLIKTKLLSKFKMKPVSEAEKIIKKHKKHLIPVSRKLVLPQKPLIELKSFEALIQISEQKELPILQFEEEKNNDLVIFYTIDQEIAYMYEATNQPEIRIHQSKLVDKL